ncbi:MAG: HAMP domain-containing histidine kinase [Jiangellaceae bacterium]|nr:HAMP domain-containing histidine kinase [Jiangellaceae bacterium]
MTNNHRSHRRRRLVLGLRGRVRLAFALVAAAIAVTIAIAVWLLVTNLVYERREGLSLAQATATADRVEAVLRTLSPPDDLVKSLGNPAGSMSMLWYQDEWHSGDPTLSAADLPTPLLERLMSGERLQQRVWLTGTPRLVVGIPLTDVDGTYAEIFPLDDMERTFRTLAATLVAVTLVAPLLGLLLGAWAGRRALRPLTEVTRAAGAVASGDLTARLEATGDPDLAPIAATFNRTAEALHRRVQGDLRFATNVSHELRTPVTTLVNAIDHLSTRREQLDLSGRKALDLLGDEVTRFERLVEDLLEISRTDAGADDLLLAETDAAELVRQSIPDTARRLLDVDPAADGLLVRVDRRRLERTITNLTQNADRHGGGLVRVSVEPAPGPTVRIAVEDAGPGVPAHLREQVFERFARGATSRDRTPGVGLGLALAAQHVRLHEGRLWVESRIGGGARFVVELPAHAPSHRQSETPPAVDASTDHHPWDPPWVTTR